MSGFSSKVSKWVSVKGKTYLQISATRYDSLLISAIITNRSKSFNRCWASWTDCAFIFITRERPILSWKLSSIVEFISIIWMPQMSVYYQYSFKAPASFLTGAVLTPPCICKHTRQERHWASSKEYTSFPDITCPHPVNPAVYSEHMRQTNHNSTQKHSKSINSPSTVYVPCRKTPKSSTEVHVKTQPRQRRRPPTISVVRGTTTVSSSRLLSCQVNTKKDRERGRSVGEGSCNKDAEKAAWPALIHCERKKRAHEQEQNKKVIQAKVYEFSPSLFLLNCNQLLCIRF